MQGLLFLSAGSDTIFAYGKCYQDASFSGTSAGFLNDNPLLLKDQSYPNLSSSLFDVESSQCKPLTDACQWLDSSAWKSMPGACNMPDFPGVSSSLLGNQGYEQRQLEEPNNNLLQQSRLPTGSN
jgi:hypothetical protein